jgi:hypothetical protein
LLLSAAPFPLAILTTLLFVTLVGTRFPRDVAPGSSLALPGLILALLIYGALMAVIRRQWLEATPRRFALLLGGLTSLMAWPVWAVGPLPSINGASIDAPSETAMRVIDQGSSPISRSRSVYYWAELEPISPRDTALSAGRYITSDHINARWATAPNPAGVHVIHARGLLGAEVVLGYR